MTIGFLKRRVFGFLEKPVSLKDLEDLLNEATTKSDQLTAADEFELDLARRQALYGGSSISLTPTEFEIVSLFLKRKGEQISRDELNRHLWGESKVSRNALDTHLVNLKKKLPPFGRKLISVYGAGYCYDA